MIRNKKIYYAVGQGGFYSEKIFFKDEIKTIVYDCGSLNTERLKKEISNSGLDTIDYLIISHFHKDHINGITELMKHSHIKNVIIPKLDPLDILFYLKKYKRKKDNGIRTLIINPSEFFKTANNGDKSKIVFIEPNSKIDNSTSHPHKENFPIIKDAKKTIWVLKFYVDKGSFGKNKLKADETKLIKSISNIDEYNKNLKDLTKIYARISSNSINLTSMSMLSAPNYIYYWNRNNAISVLNGDIVLNTEQKILEFSKHFSDFYSYKVYFHIPHHGSHKNLKRPINEWEIKKGIIMSGYENSNGHPSGVILRKFSDAKIPIKVLTEFDKNYIKFDNFYYY